MLRPCKLILSALILSGLLGWTPGLEAAPPGSLKVSLLFERLARTSDWVEAEAELEEVLKAPEVLDTVEGIRAVRYGFQDLRKALGPFETIPPPFLHPLTRLLRFLAENQETAWGRTLEGEFFSGLVEVAGPVGFPYLVRELGRHTRLYHRKSRDETYYPAEILRSLAKSESSPKKVLAHLSALVALTTQERDGQGRRDLDGWEFDLFLEALPKELRWKGARILVYETRWNLGSFSWQGEKTHWGTSGSELFEKWVLRAFAELEFEAAFRLTIDLATGAWSEPDANFPKEPRDDFSIRLLTRLAEGIPPQALLRFTDYIQPRLRFVPMHMDRMPGALKKWQAESIPAFLAAAERQGADAKMRETLEALLHRENPPRVEPPARAESDQFARDYVAMEMKIPLDSREIEGALDVKDGKRWKFYGPRTAGPRYHSGEWVHQYEVHRFQRGKWRKIAVLETYGKTVTGLRFTLLERFRRVFR